MITRKKRRIFSKILHQGFYISIYGDDWITEQEWKLLMDRNLCQYETYLQDHVHPHESNGRAQ